MEEFEKNILDYAKNMAIGSFLIGTLIFVSFVLFSIENLAYMGVLFVLLAIMANGIILFQQIYLWVHQKENRIAIRNAIFLVLANLPIAFIFLKIGAQLYTNRFGF